MKKIFLAGGTGVIGKRLVPKLVERGYDVGVLSRSNKNNSLIKEMGAEPISTDLFDQDDLIAKTAGYSVFLHMATKIPSSTRFNPEDWKMNSRLRTEGTKNLIAASLKHNSSHYIQQSFFGIYGHREGEVVNENTKISLPIPTIYDFNTEETEVINTIFEMEQIVIKAMEEQKLPATILRFGWFYGHDADLFETMVNRGFPKIGKFGNYWNMLAIDDAVSALIKTIEQPEVSIGETFNINDEPVFAKEFLTKITRIGSGKKPRWIPEFLAKLVTGKYPVNFTRSSVQISADKARDILGWKPEFDNYEDRIKYEYQIFKKKTNKFNQLMSK